MSDTPAGQSAQNEVPKADIRHPRRLSIVWLIPLAVAGIAGWIAYKAISETGPSITITFNTADGLEAGKTKIMFKGVQAGTVESIDVSEDLTQVIVHATMAKETKGHLNENTRFWVVRPEVSLTGISGLSTLVSGVFIGMEPGDGKPERAFKGLDEAPLSDEQGSRFTLKADNLGTLHVSAPVHHHGVVVGEVLGYELAKDDDGVVIHVLVRKPYDQLVRRSSLFWNASGIDLSLGNFFDASARIGSLKSLVAGGIAFASPPEPADPAPAETVFRLYDERPESLHSRAVEEGLKLVLTASDLGGVQAGDEITYRQIVVGKVFETRLAKTAAGVEIDVSIDKEHAALVRENSQFWNDSGLKLDFGDLLDPSVEASSLGSLVAGAIAFLTPTDPGPPAKPGARFALLDKRPKDLEESADAEAAALHIVLKSEVQGSVKADDPILYREVAVGQVNEVALSEDASYVAVRATIEGRYASLVRAKTVFWNASGIHASFGLFSGAEVDVESLSTLLRGGIAFATPKDGGEAAANGAAFPLHREAKKEWQKWAPHIRLPKAEPKPEPNAAAAAQGAEPAGQDLAAEPTPTAEQEATTSSSSEAAPLPTSVALSGTHVSTSALSQALAKLGFTNIGSVQHAGSIVRADADWEGEPVKLHIDTRTGRIKPIE